MPEASKLRAKGEGFIKTVIQTDALFDILYRALSGSALGDAALWAKRLNLTPQKLMNLASNPKLYAGMAELGARQTLGNALRVFGRKKKGDADPMQAANIDEEQDAANIDLEMPQQAANIDRPVAPRAANIDTEKPKKVGPQQKKAGTEAAVRIPTQGLEPSPAYIDPRDEVPEDEEPEDEEGVDEPVEDILEDADKAPETKQVKPATKKKEKKKQKKETEATEKKEDQDKEEEEGQGETPEGASFDPFTEHGGRADEPGEAPDLGKQEEEEQEESQEEESQEEEQDDEAKKREEERKQKRALFRAQTADKQKSELVRQLKDIEKDIADFKQMQEEFRPDAWWVVIPATNVILDFAQFFDGGLFTALFAVLTSIGKIVWYFSRGPEMKKFLRKRTTLMILQWTLNAIPFIGPFFPTALVEGYVQMKMKNMHDEIEEKIEDLEFQKKEVEKKINELTALPIRIYRKLRASRNNRANS